MSGVFRRAAGVRGALAALALVGSAVAAQASEFHGQVVINGVPVPGAVVTATRDGKTVTAVTDSQGVYQFPDLADGAWHITVEILGFKKFEVDATVVANKPQDVIQLQLLPMETLLATTHAQTVVPGATATPELVARTTADGKAAAKKKTDKPSAKPTDTGITEPAEKSGAASNDGLVINGSESNANTSKYSMNAAFGNRRAGSKSLYQYMVAVIADNSALNARPDSVTGLSQPVPNYNFINGQASIGGPINIPRIMPRGPYGFLNYSWTRNTIATSAQGLVPTLAQRGCSPTAVTCVPGGNADITSLTSSAVTTPDTHLSYAPTQVPISATAAALLALYPLPNLAGSSSYNYQIPILNSTHTDAVQGRLQKSIGQRDTVYGGFALQSARANSGNLFGFRDTTNTLGLTSNANWGHRFPHGIYLTSTYTFSRQRTELRPFFGGVTDVAGKAGITYPNLPAVNGVTPPAYTESPQDWGPPALGFSNGYAGLSDANSQFTRNRSDSLKLDATQTRGRHSLDVGGEFRRQEYNYFGQQNPRGSFSFDGSNTGNTYADFLLGYPVTSTVAYGNADKYLRESVANLYVNDDWRLRPELTINAGLRWDYTGPMTELKNRLINTDVANNFAQAAAVQSGVSKGPVSGQGLPKSLINPDRLGLEPRVSLAWRPFPASTLVIRAGYGIYYNTSTYLSAYQSMDQQAPLSTSINNVFNTNPANGPLCVLSFANAFQNCAGTTPQLFGIDPNFRVGNAQSWNLVAQRDLPGALVATVTYLGTKGTHGVQQFIPNTYAPNGVNPYAGRPVGYVYQTSGGNSTYESGQVQLRRRLRAGFTATAQYTYSKAIDDMSVVGGAGHVVGSQGGTAGSTYNAQIAQDWTHLKAERALSQFDQRHLLTGSLQYTSGMGLGGRTLMGGWKGRLIKEWTAITTFNVGSGLPETPVYYEKVAGTSTTGFTRPNLTGASPNTGTGGRFVNVGAYAAPAAGQWGNARRNSIAGPGQFDMDASLARTFRLKDPFNLDVRVDSTNVINHVTYSGYYTTLTAAVPGVTNNNPNPTFGLPTGANQMRTLKFTARLRF